MEYHYHLASRAIYLELPFLLAFSMLYALNMVKVSSVVPVLELGPQCDCVKRWQSPQELEALGLWDRSTE